MSDVMKRVLCQATVEDKSLFFLVEVQGAGEHAEFHRSYKIVAKSDDEAAQMGMKFFTTEMNSL